MPQPPRPRERLSRDGPQSLTLFDAVALILGSGSSVAGLEKLTSQVVAAMRLGESTFESLQSIPGLGRAKASALVAAMQLDRLVKIEGSQVLMVSPEQVYDACRDIVHEPQECLVAFYLNIRHGAVKRELISLGTASSSLVHPREVFRPAILANAQSLIVAHNHPSGDPEPSAADYQVTKRLYRAGLELGIELVDHVVCAERGFVSLRERMPSLFT